MSIFLRIFIFYISMAVLSTENSYNRPRRLIISRLSRAYNNPYHPEDDAIVENVSDEDGDNLKYGGRIDQLSDTEVAKEKQETHSRLKINGRFYDRPQNKREFDNSED